MSYTFVVLRHDRCLDELAIMQVYPERSLAEEAAEKLRKSIGAAEIRCLRETP